MYFCGAFVLRSDSVRNRENIEKVIEIQNKLVRMGNQVLVEPQRKFVKEGMLAKLSMTDDSLQTRAVYLFSDLLLTAVPLVGGLMKVGTDFSVEPFFNFKN